MKIRMKSPSIFGLVLAALSGLISASLAPPTLLGGLGKWSDAFSEEARQPGPPSLEAYCAQIPDDKEFKAQVATGKFKGYVVGQPVMADWLGFGVWFKAHISGANRDGTYNVHYTLDDMKERDVKNPALRPRVVGPRNLNPTKDPACFLKKNVDEVNRNVDQAVEEMARWVSQRKRPHGVKPGKLTIAKEGDGDKSSPKQGHHHHQNRLVPPAPAGPAGAPGPAGSPGPAPAGGGAGKAPRGVGGGGDDDGDDELRIIVGCVLDVDDELELMRGSQVELEKADKMDPELDIAIEGAVERQKSLKEGLASLQEAIAREREANEQLQGLQDAAKKAKKEVQNKLSVHEEKARKLVSAADAEVMDQVLNLQMNFRAVKQRVREFDTSVTPNNAKWWRFRYEYSHVEASILMVIIPVMMLYKYLYTQLKIYTSTDKHHLYTSNITKMHLAWLQFAAGELFVCFCVVLTIWLMATFGCLDFLVLYVRDDDMHLPTNPEQYRLMAVNISMQLGFAMIAYHLCVYSVVVATVSKFATWRSYEEEANNPAPVTSPSTRTSRSVGGSSVSHAIEAMRRGPTMTGGALEFQQMRTYFIEALERYPEIKAKLGRLFKMDKVSGSPRDEKDMASFPFAEYMCVNVRRLCDHILELTWIFWGSAWVTFVLFMLLHRFAHVSYIRIMSVVLVLLVLVLIGMLVLVRRTSERMTRWLDKDDDEQEAHLVKQEAINNYLVFSQEQWVSHLLQFSLFFLCYGFVRMVTAPWLWHIYFWNVLAISCVFVAIMLVFVYGIAPLVPVFYAAMSIPPNLSEDDAEVICESLKAKQRSDLEFSGLDSVK